MEVLNNCTICCQKLTNPCHSDSCLHKFCFECLKQWSMTTTSCPLCRTSFQSILCTLDTGDKFTYLVNTIATEGNTGIEVPINNLDSDDLDNEEQNNIPTSMTLRQPLEHNLVLEQRENLQTPIESNYDADESAMNTSQDQSNNGLHRYNLRSTPARRNRISYAEPLTSSSSDDDSTPPQSPLSSAPSSPSSSSSTQSSSSALFFSTRYDRQYPSCVIKTTHSTSYGVYYGPLKR